MLRIPNPGSDIDSFIRIFTELFDALSGMSSFGLDDISRVLVERNLATSSGYMGEEALAQSYNEDRSRDRLYNQSKMYSELFKVLGWIHPSESALRFKFTYFGAHVASANLDVTELFREALLGIAYPNEILEVKGEHIVRPFVAILRTMAELGGYLNRDEMILGPLSLTNDRDNKAFKEMIERLQALRKGANPKQLKEALTKAALKRRISTTTMGNYTRFPIAAMYWTGWAEKKTLNLYGRNSGFLSLTDLGKAALERILESKDIRGTDFAKFEPATHSSLIRLGLFEILRRAGFDVSSQTTNLQKDREVLQKVGLPKDFIFSPYQEFGPSKLSGIFPYGVESSENNQKTIKPTKGAIVQAAQKTFAVSVYAPKQGKVIANADDKLKALFASALKKAKGDSSKIPDVLAAEFSQANKKEFYPLVADLFKAIGYDCQHTRNGVNYARWDAMLIDSEYSIPIEIKSPGEEEFISVKAVRQALENKVILIARKPYTTDLETTSLVVGYNFPQDRSEVSGLIEDILKTFGVKIGVIDFRTLVRLAVESVLEGKQHSAEELRKLNGFISIKNS